jgi:hypothetical protein
VSLSTCVALFIMWRKVGRREPGLQRMSWTNRQERHYNDPISSPTCTSTSIAPALASRRRSDDSDPIRPWSMGLSLLDSLAVALVLAASRGGHSGSAAPEKAPATGTEPHPPHNLTLEALSYVANLAWISLALHRPDHEHGRPKLCPKKAMPIEPGDKSNAAH